MILGPMLEKNLLSSMIKSNGEWLAFVERPVSMALAVCFFWLSRCKDAISTVHLAVNPRFQTIHVVDGLPSSKILRDC